MKCKGENHVKTVTAASTVYVCKWPFKTLWCFNVLHVLCFLHNKWSKCNNILSIRMIDINFTCWCSWLENYVSLEKEATCLSVKGNLHFAEIYTCSASEFLNLTTWHFSCFSCMNKELHLMSLEPCYDSGTCCCLRDAFMKQLVFWRRQTPQRVSAEGKKN